MKSRAGVRLHIRLALSFFMVSMLIIIALSTSVYYFTSDMLVKYDIRRTRETVTQTGEYISSYLEKMQGICNIIATHMDIKSAIMQSDGKAAESISSLIYLIKESDVRIMSVAVVSKDGFAITSGSPMTIPLSDDMMKEEWYKKAIESGQMPMLLETAHSAFVDDEDEWVISVFREITGGNGEHLGVVLIDISYRFIEDYIGNLDLGKDGFVYIISENKEVIYHPDTAVFVDEARKNELLKLMDGDRKEGKTIYETNVANSTWKLFGAVSGDGIQVLKQKLVRTILISGLTAALLSMLFGTVVARRLSDPIIELKNAMRSLDKKWEHIVIKTSDIYEVTELLDEYNRLIDRIRELTQNISREENARRVFELKALQSQINPHFLYNTLDTILWLAQLGENDGVVKVASSLGKLLRFSLNIDDDMVTLNEELNHVRYYLEIQKVRYEEMLNYNIDGDEGILDIKIPKLILQPIVENAIYHGIRPKGGGHIDINYKKTGDDIVIEIADNGCGFDEKSVEKKSVKPRLSGIGIKNVEQRIKLMCGEQYGLKIESAAGEGTTVTVILGERKGGAEAAV